MKASITLLAIVILLLSENASSFLSVNVTRLQKNDKFTNPNRTAVSNCVTSGQSSFADSCGSFRSTDTRAVCSNHSSSCCQWCQCKDDFPMYLFHLGKCVNLTEVNTDIFGQGSIGCGARLEVKAGGRHNSDNDDDDDDDDDDDNSRHGKDICKDSSWAPPVINFQNTTDPKIKFCLVKPKDIESCDLEAARYVGNGQWKNFTDFWQAFWAKKKGKDMYLQWNNSAVSKLTWNLVVINISCKQKGKGKKGKNFTSCFMFKTAGTFIAAEKTTTAKPATKKTATTEIATTKPTTTKPVTTKQTTMKPTTATKPTTKQLSTKAPPTTTTTTTKTKLTTTIATTTEELLTEETTTKRTTTKPTSEIHFTTKSRKTTTHISHIHSTTESTEKTTTSFIDIETNTEPKERPSHITMTTTEQRSAGKDKVIDSGSRDGSSSRSTAVIVVSVLCTLLAVAALCFVTVWLLRKRRRPKNTIKSSEQNTRHCDKPDDHIYQTQDNFYQLLTYDEKSKAHDQWEQPAYQGLTKGSTEGDWGEGEVYTNPVMYQELKKSEIAAENDYLPAYHPIMKHLQSKPEQGPEYDQGYLVLVGGHNKEEETADQEDPYYHKVEHSVA